MAVKWNDLSTKKDNYDGGQGKLTANEWNDFVIAVKSHDDSIKTLNSEAIKGVYINGNTFTVQEHLDSDGILQVGTLTSNRNVSFTFDGYPDGKLPQTPITITSDTKSLKFKFTVNDKKSNGDPFTTVLGSSLTYTIVNTTNNSVHHIYTQQNSICDGTVVEFDFMQYGKSILSNEGSYSLSITYANNGATDSAGVNCDVVNLNVSFDPEFTDIYTATGNSANFPIVVARPGAVLHCTINGKDIEAIPFVDSDTIKLYDTILKHSIDGTNNFKLYVSYEKNGVPINSNEYEFRYLYIKSSNQSKITSTVTNGSIFKVYENMVVDYILYSSKPESNVKVIAQLYIDDTPVEFIEPIEKTVNLDENKIGRETVVFSLMPKGEIDADDISAINKIKISCDTLSVSDTIDIVIEKQDVPFKEVTDNLIAYFDADGKTMDVKEWVSDKVVNGVNHKYEFDLSQLEFIPGSSGWYTDVTNGSSLRIKRGKRATLNYKPFKKEVCYTGSSNNDGLTISIEFKTSKCFDDNAPVISCINSEETGNDRGFVINTSNMLLSGSTKSLTTKFNENARLRVDFVIDGKTSKYTYKSYNAENAEEDNYDQVGGIETSEEALMLIYIDGVYAGFREFSNDKLAFIQTTPQDITFGSDYCDLDIYKIRIYNTALSVPQILSNFAFDANGFENKCAIANRNNIFAGTSPHNLKTNKPNIDRVKLGNALPNLPVFTVELTDEYNTGDAPGELTNTKEDWQKTAISRYYDSNKLSTNVTVPLTSWETKPGRSQIRNQGTSSMGYPWPWRNWDWKTKEYFVPNVNGTETSRWLQYVVNPGWNDDIMSTFGLQKLTFKKDYASSEMCNNAICSELFTEFAKELASVKNDKGDYKYIGTDENAFDSILSKPMKDQFMVRGGTDYRFSLKAKPCFMYQKLSYSPDGDPENKEGTAGRGYDAMGMMNLIPNKNEVGYLGFTSNKWEDNEWDADGNVKPKEGKELNTSLEQAWELTENKSDVYWKKPFPPASVDSNGFYVKDIVEAYEARTPKDSPIFVEGDTFAEDQDFGHAPKEYVLSETQLKALDGQTEKIRRFHNWLVQVDRGTCTGKTLYDLEMEMEGKYWYIEPFGNLTTESRYKKEYIDVDPTVQVDDAAWRLRRFKTEYKDYIIKNQWLMYYLWREMLWMFDSGFKNLQIYTLDGDHWGCMVRDADTALGINNVGVDMFPPHLEDTDLYRSDNGKIVFSYDAANEMYNVDQATDAGLREVLNGQFGSIWLNIRDSFGTELQNMYKDLKTKGVTAKYLIDAFRNHQENWCEALYNFGLRQYCFGAAFNKYFAAALGDKKHHRAQWLTRGKYYRDTKYNAYDSTDIATGRFRSQSVYIKKGENEYELVDNNNNLINITTYIPCYLGMGGTDAAIGSIVKKFRVVDVNNDKNYNIDVPIGEGGLGIRPSDTNWYLWGVEYITEFKDLYKYVGVSEAALNELNFPKLRKLELGQEVDRGNGEYFTLRRSADGEELQNEFIPILSNSTAESMSCNTLKSLSCLDLTNWTNLNSLLKINECEQLEEIYLRRTGLQSINLPSTSTLHTVYLGDKLTSLTMENVTGIKKFVIGNDAENGGNNPTITANSIANLSDVTITNCNEYMQKKSEELINKAIVVNDKTNTITSKLKSVNLTGINWGNNEIVGPFSNKRLNYLLDITNKLEGVINIDEMSTELKLKLVGSKGNVDNINNPLYVTYTNETPIYNAKFKYSDYWLEPNNEMLDLGGHLIFNYKDENNDYSSFPNPNTMNNIVWSLSDTSERYVKIDPNTGVITRVDDAYVTEDPIEVICTITQKPNPHNPSVNVEIAVKCNLFLSKHVAKIGDVIYPDGSFSDKYIAEDNPIGICFYVDEENPDNRLMFATQFINNSNLYSWGMGKHYSGTENENHSSCSPLVQDNPIPGDKSIYTNVESGTPALYNINNVKDYDSLIENMVDGTPLINTENYVYQQNGVYRFKDYNTTYAVSEIGFKTINKDMQTYKSYADFLSDDKTLIAKKDSFVPIGQYNTVNIINTRNLALLYPGIEISKYIDGGIDNIIPFTSDKKSEHDMLLENINNIKSFKLNGVDNETKDGSMDFYYPSASLAWAYNPCNVNSSITNIDAKFTEHNWFLPAAGDGLRISYFINAVVKESFNNLSEGFTHFANDRTTKALFNRLAGYSFVTSTEYTQSVSYGTYKAVIMGTSVNGCSSGNTTNFTSFKSDLKYVLPICKF